MKYGFALTIHSTAPHGVSVLPGCDVRQLSHPKATYLQTSGRSGLPPEQTYYRRGSTFLVGRSGWGEFQQAYRDESFFALVRNHESSHVELTFVSRSATWVDKGPTGVPAEIGRATHGRDADVVEVCPIGEGTRRRVIFHRGGEYLVVIDDVEGSQSFSWPTGVDGGDVDGAVVTFPHGSEHGVLAGLNVDTVTVDGRHVTVSGGGASTPIVTVLGVSRRGTFETVADEISVDIVALRVKVGSVEYPVFIQDMTVTEFDPRVDDGDEDVEASGPSINIADLPEYVASTRTELSTMTRSQAQENVLPGLIQTYRSLAGSPESTDSLASLIIDVAGEDWNLVPVRVRHQFPRRRDPFYAFSGETVETGESGRPWPLEWVDERAALDAVRNGESVCSFSTAGDLLIPWAALNPGEDDVLVVRLHGAVNRQQLALPALPGLTSAALAGGSQLIIQDPSLDLDRDLNLGWYLGSPMVDGHEAVAELIVTVAEAQGVSKIVIQGNSGGGFAALHLASLIPGSIAVAFNPQTDLAQYFPRLTRRAIDVCCGSDDDAVGLSVMKRWQGRSVRAHVLANTGDEFHMTRHVKPLEDLAAEQPDWDVQFHYFDWGPGHVPPPDNDYQPGIDLALADLRGEG